MSLVLDKGKLINLYKAELLYEIHRVSECIRLFEIKYGKTFEEFEKEIKASPEKFEVLDDYMEWIACVKSLATLKKMLKKLESGDIRLS